MICNPSPEAEFPFSAQFRAVMSDAPTTTYGFVVTKTGASSPWTMTKAWRQSNGVTMDLTLPPTEVQAAANAELQRRKEAEGTANHRLEGTDHPQASSPSPHPLPLGAYNQIALPGNNW